MEPLIEAFGKYLAKKLGDYGLVHAVQYQKIAEEFVVFVREQNKKNWLNQNVLKNWLNRNVLKNWLNRNLLSNPKLAKDFVRIEYKSKNKNVHEANEAIKHFKNFISDDLSLSRLTIIRAQYILWRVGCLFLVAIIIGIIGWFGPTELWEVVCNRFCMPSPSFTPSLTSLASITPTQAVNVTQKSPVPFTLLPTVLTLTHEAVLTLSATYAILPSPTSISAPSLTPTPTDCERADLNSDKEFDRSDIIVLTDKPKDINGDDKIDDTDAVVLLATLEVCSLTLTP